MKKQILKFQVLIVLYLVLALACSDAYARGGHHGGGGHYGGRGWNYYDDGRWYQHGWFWADTVVTALAIGALVESLPPRYNTVVYTGVPYYYADGYYYRPYDYGGYVVVAPPVMAPPAVVVPQQAPIVQAPAGQPQGAQASNMVTINIPNSKGGYTPVTLQKAGGGYIGPQGEYYSENPTVEQLKTLYGGK